MGVIWRGVHIYQVIKQIIEMREQRVLFYNIFINYFTLLVCFVTVLNIYGSSLSHNKRDLIVSVLEESVFNYSLPVLTSQSLQILMGVSTYYDPVLFSVMPAITSKRPDKNEERWMQVELPPNQYSIACPNDIKAWFRKSNSNSSYTYIIMPGAYTPWGRGSYINQISDILERHFQDPNIIAFSGFNHPEFLAGSCTSIPWDRPIKAKDIYLRLVEFLEDIAADPEHTGLIGVSLGASFSFMMMGYDAERSRREDTDIVFGLGGFAISPPLHAMTTYLNLDGKYRNTEIDPSDSLTAYNFWNFIPKAFGYVWYGFLDEATDIVSYFESDRKQFINRTYNEFTVVNLKNLLLSIEPDRDIDLGEISYYTAFVEEGFEKKMNSHPDRLRNLLKSIDPKAPDIVGLSEGGWQLSDQNNYFFCDKPTNCIIQFCETEGSSCLFSIQNLHNKAVDIKSFLTYLDRPFFLFLSKDDPILHSQDEQGHPPSVITDILNSASDNENTIVFHPKYGGHTGLLLDPIFENLVVTFFSPE